MSSIRSIATALALATVACGPRNPFDDSARYAPTAAAVLRVVNNNWATVIVYGVTDGQTFRLGSVETGMTMTFRLPAVAVASGDLQLRVYALGSRDVYESGPIVFAPGETIELVVENALPLSSYYVYQE